MLPSNFDETLARALVEAGPDALLVCDGQGRVVLVNAEAERLFGYPRDELLGQPVEVLIPAQHREAHVAQRTAFTASPLARPMGAGRKLLGRKRDGSAFPAEISLSPVRTKDGVFIAAAVRDLSEMRRLERALAEVESLLHAIVEQCPVGIARVSRRGDDAQVELNERGQEIMGRPGAVLPVGVYVPFMEWPDGTPLRPEEAPTSRALRGEHVAPLELLIVHPDGRRVPIQARGAPLLDPSGAVVGGIVTFDDITAEKDLERMRTEWNAIVAHDLRNPLNIIGLHAQLLARGTRGQPALLESVQEIQGAAARMNRMVHDLLDLSRLEAHNLALERAEVALGGVVRKAVARAALTAPDRSFAVEAGDDLPPVLADADRIAQVLDNLLSNAVKYGTPGTPITVTVEPSGSGVAVAVTNQGAGIAPTSVRQLFQRFQRAADGRLASVKGIGLGLYIVRELIEAHGGRIGVESELEGTTTFRFTLPAA